MSLGFEQAGFQVAAAFDLEEFNVATHKENFPKTFSTAVDLAKQSGDSLRKLAGLQSEEIDVVFGGPPCQGFSFGGHQDANDPRNLLVYDFARLVREINPRYFVMENVKGLMCSRARPVLESLLRRIMRSGYEVVAPITILNSADYGVPQRRHRTFILGYKKGTAAPCYPEPVSSTNRVLVRDAILDLPNLENCEELYERDEFTGKLCKPHSNYAALMRLPAPEGRNTTKHLSGCLRTRHSDQTIRRFSKTRQGDCEPVSRYFRLELDGISPTIRAGTGRDHGSHTAPRPIHPVLNRCITSREAARLHSLPDWFRFHGTRWHDFRQIGNSVPPLLAQAVARSVLYAIRKA